MVAKAVEIVEKEWSSFLSERDATVNEIRELRQRVVEEEARKQAEREAVKTETEVDAGPDPVCNNEQTGNSVLESVPSEPKMDVDESPTEEGHGLTSKQDGSKPDEPERKDDTAMVQADDEDAVEY